MSGRLILTAAIIGCCGGGYAQGSFSSQNGFRVTMAPVTDFPEYGLIHKTTAGNGKFYIETGENVGVPAGIAALYVAIDWSTSTTTNYSGACQAAVWPRFRWTLNVTPPSAIPEPTIYVPITFDWGQYMEATVDTSHHLSDNFWSEASTSDLYGRDYSLYDYDTNILDPLIAFSVHSPTRDGSFGDRKFSASPAWRLIDISKAHQTVTVACTLQKDGTYAGSSAVFYIPGEGALLGYVAFSQPISPAASEYYAQGYSLSAAGPMVLGIGSVIPAQGPASVNLGLAGNYTIFADTGISNATTPAAITGNIGVGPGVTSTAITGFALTLPAASSYSTSAQVSDKVYAFDYAAPTPTNVTTASQDMAAAYADAAGRIHPDHLNLGGGNLAGLTLYPGLYQWGTAVHLPVGTNVTLSGGPNDVWIFQISGTLTTGASTHVFLSGGAQAKNIFWQVAGTSVTLGANAKFEGIVLAKVAINFGSKASETGRLLAQAAVNLDQNAVTQPAP